MPPYLKLFYLVFGVLTFAGGLMGYLKKGSMASLIAGSILGALLVIGALALGYRPIVGMMLGLVASVAVTGKFLPDLLQKRAFFPAGIMSILGVAGIALTLIVWYSL